MNNLVQKYKMIYLIIIKHKKYFKKKKKNLIIFKMINVMRAYLYLVKEI